MLGCFFLFLFRKARLFILSDVDDGFRAGRIWHRQLIHTRSLLSRGMGMGHRLSAPSHPRPQHPKLLSIRPEMHRFEHRGLMRKTLVVSFLNQDTMAGLRLRRVLDDGMRGGDDWMDSRIYNILLAYEMYNVESG